nr:VWA domain-containing protein [Clostridium sp. Cult2]
MIDKIGNEIYLKCLILLDTSGSMKNKIAIARKSIYQLLRFLKERKGENHIGFMIFPGENGHYQLLCDFTLDIDELKGKIQSIDTGGTTPTGYAIEGAIRTFAKDDEEHFINQYIV